MILEEQPAFNLHIRSANSLRKSPKRHFCDVSLAVAALKLNKEALNIITCTGMSYTRPDGVNVISISSLGK